MTVKTQNDSRRKRVILGGIVGAALAGVALLPGTGWIARQQVRILFSGPTPSILRKQESSPVTVRQEQAAAAQPSDFPLQMALALRRDSAPPTDGAGGESSRRGRPT